MLSNEQRASIDELWRLFRSAGIFNPPVSLENIFYLMLSKHMEVAGVGGAKRSAADGSKERLRKELRWSDLMRLESSRRLEHFKEKIFPFLKTTGANRPSFPAAMKGAVFE